MGMLIDGVWHEEGTDSRNANGRYVHPDSRFRNWITAEHEIYILARPEYTEEAGYG